MSRLLQLVLLHACFQLHNVAADESAILKHPQDPIIDVGCSISHNHISNTSPTKIGVLFDITTPNITSSDENSNVKASIRKPYELAIVLDRSGSMVGDKIEQAKLAIISIIDNMIQGDIIHIIQYDHDVQLLVENGGKKEQNEIIKKVNSIFPGGATNLFDGLLTAYNVLKKSMKNEIKHKEISHSRIFLFSDGLLNAGITDNNKILDFITKWKNELDITISSFGIGYDFDRKLMNSIAETGRGDFFFINSAKTISKVVDIARKDAASMVGTEAVLTIKTATNNTENVNIKINNMFERGLFAIDENEYINFNQIDIRDLRAGDSKYVLIELLIDVKDENKLDKMNVIEWSLEYNDVISKTTQTIEGKVDIALVGQNDNKLKSENNMNDHVAVFWKLNEILELDKEILDDIEEEKYDQAIRKRTLLRTQKINNLKRSDAYYLFTQSSAPSLNPSLAPTMAPSNAPSAAPSVAPSDAYSASTLRMLERIQDEEIQQKVDEMERKLQNKERIGDKEKEDILMDYGSSYGYSQHTSSNKDEL